MNPQVFFVLVFSGYTATVLFAREAAARRARLSAVAGMVAGVVLILLAYLYFPMGVADCYDWLQDDARQQQAR